MRLGFALLLTLATILAASSSTTTANSRSREHRLARDFFESTVLGLMSRTRTPFLEGFGNATALLHRTFDAADGTGAAGEEGRGKKKRLKQMNRTLMAVVMAYTLKFMFLIPTFVGTLVLFKFTAALAGFFYALFAAVLGLDHPHHEG